MSLVLTFSELSLSPAAAILPHAASFQRRAPPLLMTQHPLYTSYSSTCYSSFSFPYIYETTMSTTPSPSAVPYLPLFLRVHFLSLFFTLEESVCFSSAPLPQGSHSSTKEGRKKERTEEQPLLLLFLPLFGAAVATATAAPECTVLRDYVLSTPRGRGGRGKRERASANGTSDCEGGVRGGGGRGGVFERLLFSISAGGWH